jgi:hypothetical protein
VREDLCSAIALRHAATAHARTPAPRVRSMSNGQLASGLRVVRIAASGWQCGVGGRERSMTASALIPQ